MMAAFMRASLAATAWLVLCRPSTSCLVGKDSPLLLPHHIMQQMKSEIRDGMQIDWDAPIAMDDGVVLRADVFRPTGGGKYPVILSYGPYAKGLAFQEAYKSAWT